MNKLQRCIEMRRRSSRPPAQGIRVALLALTLISFLMAGPAKAEEQETSTSPGAPGTQFNSPQRVVLYDEDPTDPKGRQYVGSVIMAH